jgi:two-component system, LytTR family, response regulator
MAHRHEVAELEQSTPADRSLDTFDPHPLTNLPVEKDDRTLRLDDFVFLSDNTRCWLIRTADIWFLEACGDQTRVHLQDATVLVRRLLPLCERRLDSSTFFRATRDCVINLLHVKQTRLLDSSHVLFVLPTGKEVVVSGRQNVLFRKMRAL